MCIQKHYVSGPILQFIRFICRDEIKNLTEMTNKIKEFQNQIENLTGLREELVESTQSLEGQLVEKRNDLNSEVESGQIKTTAMER